MALRHRPRSRIQALPLAAVRAACRRARLADVSPARRRISLLAPRSLPGLGRSRFPHPGKRDRRVLRHVLTGVRIGAMTSFHPLVGEWFESRFGRATEPQLQGWPLIASGRDVLISAPTGSGKTLAALLPPLARPVGGGRGGGAPGPGR